jgi:hypothetical protein
MRLPFVSGCGRVRGDWFRCYPLAQQTDHFFNARQASGLLFRINLFPIDENIQRSRGTRTHPNGKVELPFNLIFEAPGLSLNVTSKKAAPDFDCHTINSNIDTTLL